MKFLSKKRVGVQVRMYHDHDGYYEGICLCHMEIRTKSAKWECPTCGQVFQQNFQVPDVTNDTRVYVSCPCCDRYSVVVVRHSSVRSANSYGRGLKRLEVVRCRDYVHLYGWHEERIESEGQIPRTVLLRS